VSAARRYDLVVIGGGQAAGNLVQALRRNGYDGSLCVVGDESHPPYERPPLSKAVLLGEMPDEGCYLASAEDFQRLCAFRPGRRAIALDASARRVRLDDGEVLEGGAVVLATGARARRLPVAGASLAGVFSLRSLADAEVLRGALQPGLRLAVIGGGTVGLEVASAALRRGLRVTVVETAKRLLPRLLPPQLAEWLATEFTLAGARLVLGARVAALHGEQRIAQVELAGGRRLDCDLAVCGVGAEPNAELAAAGGLAVDGGVLVDGEGRASLPGIYAIGDVAAMRDPAGGRPRRLESWDNALRQAERLAALLSGQPLPAQRVPWFWTDQLGRNIQLLGDCPPEAAAVMRGPGGKAGFTVVFHAEGQVLGAAAVDRGRDIRVLREIMERRLAVQPADLADPDVRLDRLLRSASAAPAPEPQHAV